MLLNLKCSVLASNIRLLTSTYDGYVQIKDDSTWRYLEDKNWDKIRQKMLCQHLGFKETDANTIESRRFSAGYNIATGDLICYKKQPSGTSCCAHLKPSTNQRTVRVQYARCKYIHVCMQIIICMRYTFSRLFAGFLVRSYICSFVCLCVYLFVKVCLFAGYLKNYQTV